MYFAYKYNYAKSENAPNGAFCILLLNRPGLRPGLLSFLNDIFTKQIASYHTLIQAAFDFYALVTLDLVAHAHVVVVFNADTALDTALDFINIILKAA